jgi:hypothetical protein
MIHNNNEHTKQADSFDEVYSIDIGAVKEFNDAYDKWAKKNGIQSGWQKNKGRFNCKTIKEE